MILLVTLERNPIREMPAFDAAIAAGGRYVWQVMRNVWLVDTRETAPQLFERLRHHMTQTDNLLIIRAQGHYSGWLRQETWNWLNTSVRNNDF